MKSPEQMALDMIYDDLRITDAKISVALDYKHSITSLYNMATDQVSALMTSKRDLEARIEQLSPTIEQL